MLLKNPIGIPLEDMAPPPGLFLHESRLHGQLHVARVMVHAFALLHRLDLPEEAPRLWAAVYLHDLGRTHDGVCDHHGANAVKRSKNLPEVRALFERGGLRPEDAEVVAFAVTRHAVPQEVAEDHPHRRLTALLKDADGLDRARLWDLDPNRPRFAVTPTLVPFAQTLHVETQVVLTPGRDLFPRVWEIAQEVWVGREVQGQRR